MSRLTLAALAALAACVDAPPPTPLPRGDAAVFAALAQPALDERCATPSCHGDGRRPFAVYSPGQRRADPARLHLHEPLTAAELAANQQAIAALALDVLVADAPRAAVPVLCKPLAITAGGCGHTIGPIFAGADDRDYQALAAFVATLELP